MQIYLTPEDVADFESALRAHSDVILSSSSSSPRPVVAASVIVQTPETKCADGYIVRPGDVGRVSMLAVSPQDRWTVDALRSPVIELFGCHFDGKTLKRGRLFYDQGFYESTGVWVEKPMDFDAWAKDVFKLARKMFKRDPKLDAYVGPRAMEWHSKFNGTFVALSFAPPSVP